MNEISDYNQGKRFQVEFDLFSENVEIVQPRLYDKDLNFKFSVPKNFVASEHIENLSLDNWTKKLEEARSTGVLNDDLVNKILTSLDRLPALEINQKLGVCYSGGKDGAASLILCIMKYGIDNIFIMFADTKDEWPETYKHIPEFIKWSTVKDFTVLESMGIHTLLEEHISCWPILKRRHCTKNLKMLPMRDHLDEQGYDQVRLDRKHALFRPSHVNGATYIDVNYIAPLLVSGERHMEGVSRSKINIEPERDPLLLRVTARPIIEWSIIDVWDFLFWMKAPYNPVYLWIKRVACSGCPFAGDEELMMLGKMYPEKLEKWVHTEKVIGVPRIIGKSFIQVQNELKSEYQLKKSPN